MRFSNYPKWRDIAFGIKNTFGQDGHELYLYMCNKCPDDIKKKGIEQFWQRITRTKNGIGLGSLFLYAKQDNLPQFWKIMNTHNSCLKISHDNIAKLLYKLYPERFIWSDKKLICFNGSCWEEDNLAMQRTIIDELLPHLYQVEKIKLSKLQRQLMKEKADSAEAKMLQAKISLIEKIIVKTDDLGNTGLDKLHDNPFIEQVYKASRKYFTNNDIKYDDMWYILPFNNLTFDLLTQEFRPNNPEDHCSMSVGYDWEEPNQEEVDTINHIIEQIIPDKEIREFLLSDIIYLP